MTLLFENEIKELLVELEKEENIKILFASDNGSRSYGWSLVRSDFDIHLIYTRPVEFYITIQNKSLAFDKQKFIKTHKGSIECNFIGWDIKNALLMFSKSNAALTHALTSPMIYLNHKLISDTIKFYSKVYTKSMLVLSLGNLIKGNFQKHVFTKDKVRIKIYLYLLHHVYYIKYMMDHEKEDKFPPLHIFDLTKGTLAVPIIKYLILLRKKGEEHVKRLYRVELLVSCILRVCKKWGKEIWKSKKEVVINLDELDIIFNKSLKI